MIVIFDKFCKGDKEMNNQKTSNITIEGARIGFRNFSGKEGKFNPPGRRNFCVFLDLELAKTLEEDGWNVRWLQPRDDQEDMQGYLQVAVSFDNIPPKIVLITSNGKSVLDDESISILDWAEIGEIDLIIRPYHWEMSGKKGIKGYVKSMYVSIAEDEFEKKWSNSPDSAETAMCDDCASVNGSCADCKKCHAG